MCHLLELHFLVFTLTKLFDHIMKYTILYKHDYEQNDQRYEKYNQNIKKVVKKKLL